MTECYLKVGLCKAASHSNHGSSEGARHTDGGQELRDVGGQAERNRPVGIQITSGIVYVKTEVRNIELPCVLLKTHQNKTLHF